MKTINNTVLERLNKLEKFVLKYDDGKSVLWEINAPGLHVLTVAYHFMRFAGERGKWALLYHSYNGDFFAKAYDILNIVGLKEESSPEVWGYIRKLEKYSNNSSNPELKATANVQLFTYIQGFLESILYAEFIARNKKAVKENQDIFKELLVAADSFVVRTHERGIEIFAGYPWFDQTWGRDTFISLPGLLLVTKRFEYAKSVFNNFCEYQNKEGLLPNTVTWTGKKEYNSADASLWFVEALNKYHLKAKSKDADSFVKKMIPTVNSIIEAFTKSWGDIYLDTDNLVVIPAQWSWMDAVANGAPVTPRKGKPVEIQALFYNALKIAAKFNLLSGNKRLANDFEALAVRTAKSINEKFFPSENFYPYDVLSDSLKDASIRPNAVFLVGLSATGDLLSQERKLKIIDTIEKELLTPYGLRSLSMRDPNFIGSYHTFAPQEMKDQAYHQGTIWPYLLLFYFLAKRSVTPPEKAAALDSEIKEKLSDLFRVIRNNETVPELFSGDRPYTPGGAASQAWSVSAALETYSMLYGD
jgi:glycogen debranching enzyme